MAEPIVLPDGKVIVTIPYTLTNRTGDGSIYGFVQAPIMFVWDPEKETYLETLQRSRTEVAECIAEYVTIARLRFQAQDDDLV